MEIAPRNYIVHFAKTGVYREIPQEELPTLPNGYEVFVATTAPAKKNPAAEGEGPAEVPFVVPGRLFSADGKRFVVPHLGEACTWEFLNLDPIFKITLSRPMCTTKWTALAAPASR